jgi:subtilisin family serine protease
MSEKEYIVTLNKNVDYAAFNQEMIANTGAGDIPSRSVTVANARPGSQRNTHYMLTDDEASALATDTRVLAVELRPDLRNDITIERRAVQTGDFSKTLEDRGFFINWGLRRMNEATNPYSNDAVGGGYNYTLDGTGVDIVIQDSGLQIDHPEFQDSNGVSRVVELDWYAASGLPGTMPTAHYTDYDGHGTHVAGIATGKTYGWAKGATVYSVKVAGLEGPTDPNTGIPVADCFDVITAWHNAKPIDPATGVKRPTIVNMSWGYSALYTAPTAISYRGVTHTGTEIDEFSEAAAYGLIVISSSTPSYYSCQTRIASVDVDVQEMIDAGIHVCIAAGNSYHKIDVVGGADYDNSLTNSFSGVKYYNRGSSPFSEEANIVGNIDSDINADTLEQKALSSESGPGVSIYAPGTNIMSCTSTVNKFAPDIGPYPPNDNFSITNISGTSMASPQVAGMLALTAQINPSLTPAQAKAFLNNVAASDVIHTTGLDNDYADHRSIKGSNNKFAFNKFNSAVQLRIGN